MTTYTLAKPSCLAALALLVAACDPGIELMANVDLDRDVCVGTRPRDKLPIENVDGTLSLSPFSLKRANDPYGSPFLVEIGKLMAAHNEKATNPGQEYTVFFSSPRRLRSTYYSTLGAGIVCPGIDRDNCRNRNFWTYKKIAPELMAKIIFESTINATPTVKNCIAIGRANPPKKK